MTETNISTFWLAHPEYWITTIENQPTVDKLLYDKFHKYDYNMETNLGQIIYFDQLVRHFSRVTKLSEEDVYLSRRIAVKIVESMNLCELINTAEKELIWYLMPWKHTQSYKPIFNVIDSWLNGRSLTEFQYLNRFFMDTYKKAYNDSHVASSIVLSTGTKAYDKSICETHPNATVNPNTESLISLLPKDKKIAVSLSGGVDSMLMATLLSKVNADVVAIHIVYGNRKESEDEYNFIASYCAKINIPLYIYRIEYLRRKTSEREFYEMMTRILRFSAYKVLGRPVLLGHIQEDVVENIWTNLAHGTHLDNLAKLEYQITEQNVIVYRPWLSVKKEQIYASAKALDVPYLKNSTPAWSNRGKFRENFYQATHAQYGSKVDQTMIEVADRIKKQATLLDKLLFQKISKSWCSEMKSLNITDAITVELDADGWLRIFTDLAHNKLGLGKPTFKSCENFVWKVSRGLKNKQLINLKKNLNLVISKDDDETWIQLAKGH